METMEGNMRRYCFCKEVAGGLVSKWLVMGRCDSNENECKRGVHVVPHNKNKDTSMDKDSIKIADMENSGHSRVVDHQS
jgi:hypothetical protein